MIENDTLETFIKQEINLTVDNNDDNITISDYSIANLSTIKTEIRNTSDKEEFELTFNITYNTGDIGHKLSTPCTITVVNLVLGDTSTSYNRYILNKDTLNLNSIWRNQSNKNSLLEEALTQNPNNTNGYKVTK